MSANTECKKSASLSIQQRRGRRPEGYILLHTVRKARSAWVRLTLCRRIDRIRIRSLVQDLYCACKIAYKFFFPFRTAS